MATTINFSSAVSLLNTDIVKALETIKNNNMIIVDDHNKFEVKLEGLAIQTNYKNNNLVACYKYTRYFQVNPLYYNERDNKVHLATFSVGGVVDLRYSKNLEEAIDKYNYDERFNNDILILIDMDK